MKKMMFGLTALVCSTILFSQGETQHLEISEVTITANKLVQKQSETGKVVTVIDQQTIQNNLGKSVPELLHQFASIFINGANNPLGTNLEFYFRGSNSGNVLILMDGNPVNDASLINNSFDLNHLSLAQIERIEIIKGAQSTIWGSDAMAGVVNIITKKGGERPFNIVSGFQYGSYQTLKANVGIQGQIRKFTYSLGGDLVGSKGFTAARDSSDQSTFFRGTNYDRDGFQQQNFQMRLAYEWSKNFKISGSTSLNRYKTDLDAGPFADDKDNTAKNFSHMHNISVNYQKNRLAVTLSGTYLEAERNYLDDSLDIGGFSSYQEGTYKGNSGIIDAYANYTLSSKVKCLFGYQHTRFGTTQRYFSSSFFGNYETNIADSATVANSAIYLSLLLAPLKNLHIDLGSRLNFNSLYGNNTTFTVNPSYQFDQNSKVFVNISTAYKIPTLYQLYSESGNKALNPEVAVNYEFGYHFQENAMDFRVLAFHRSIKNLIVYQFDPNTFVGNYINRDEQKDYGLELEWTTSISTKLKYTGNLTYVFGKGTVDGQRINNLYRRPNLLSNHSLQLNWKRLSWTPAIRFVGERIKGEFDLGDAILKAYFLIDNRFGFQYNKSIGLFAELRNCTNQIYIDAPGYTSRRFNAMVGINANF